MIAFRESLPQQVDVDRYRALLGPEADGLSDEQLALQLDADRVLARALVSLISTAARESGKEVAS